MPMHLHGSVLRGKHPRRVRRFRGVALLLTLIAMTVATVVVYSYVGTQSTSLGIARNVADLARSRYVAESGLDFTLAYIRGNPAWRTAKPNGTWVSGQTLCGGKVTLRVDDGIDANGDGSISVPGEGDGDLTNDSSQPFTITVTGLIERRNASNQLLSSVTHITRAQVRMVGTDLPSYWALDEGSGSTVTGGDGQVGTLTNMNPATSWGQGRFGTALKFNGSNSYVTMPDTSAVEITTAGTVSAWINISAFTNTYAGIVHKGTRTDFADEAYSLQFWGGNKIYWGLTAADGSHPNVVSSITPPTGEWVNVVGTWDSSAMKLYINGALVGSRAGAESIRSTGAFNIGAQLNASPFYAFNGMIDDVRIYNRSLSATEAASLASGNTPQAVTSTYLVDWRP